MVMTALSGAVGGISSAIVHSKMEGLGGGRFFSIGHVRFFFSLIKPSSLLGAVL
jgi:hypothetical protein